MEKTKKIKERNLIRTKYLVKGEFEIANKEFLELQKGIWFKRKLDYNSFVDGFARGVEYQKRIVKNFGFNLEQEKK